MDNNYLSHHGIKGQKWGVRRFQNEDGSLTSAGKLRQAKKDYSKKEDAAFTRYNKTIDDMEKPYKKGQKLSKQDLKKELEAEERYNNDVEKAKVELKEAKNTYKSDTALNKTQKNIRLGATAVATILTTPIGGAVVAYGTTKYMRSKNDIERNIKGEAAVKDVLANIGGYELYERK